MIDFKYIETNISTKTLESNIGQIPDVHPNPRTITTLEYEKLKKSIRRNGIIKARSPIVYKYEGRHVVICGNMRLKASKEVGLTDIPVFLIDEELNADQLNELQVIENKNNGDWDWDLLANEWPEDQLEEWGIDTPGINDAEAEWVGMPSYESTDQGPYRQIIISFNDDASINEFAELIGQTITNKTKSLWFPMVQPGSSTDEQYI